MHAVSSCYAPLTFSFGITVSAKLCGSHSLLPWYLNWYMFTWTCTKANQKKIAEGLPVTSTLYGIITCTEQIWWLILKEKASQSDIRLNRLLLSTAYLNQLHVLQPCPQFVTKDFKSRPLVGTRRASCSFILWSMYTGFRIGEGDSILDAYAGRGGLALFRNPKACRSACASFICVSDISF